MNKLSQTELMDLLPGVCAIALKAGEKIMEIYATDFDVALKDGRDVRCKAAGRLAKERVRLRVGDEVLVKFLLDIDEDAQTPSIVAKQLSSSTNIQDAARR